MKHITIKYLVIIFTFLACEKESIEFNDKKEIQIGDYDKMIVANQNEEILECYDEEVYQDLDINNDKVYDYRVIIELLGPRRQGQYSISIVSLDSNNLILGRLLNDTTYFHYQIDTTFDESNSNLNIFFNTIYTCLKMDINDSIIKIYSNKFHVNFFKLGDYINTSDNYKSGDFNLASNNFTVLNDGPLPSVTGDTLYYFISNYYIYCNSIPYDDITYIGIKIKNNDAEKIGWIKMHVPAIFKLNILETAIQK